MMRNRTWMLVALLLAMPTFAPHAAAAGGTFMAAPQSASEALSQASPDVDRDEEANNMKEVKDSRPKRPGPAPTRNPNGSLNAERAGALAEVPGLINNGLRCVANGGVPKH